MMGSIVHLDSVPVLVVEAVGGVVGAREAFHRLEHSFSSLKGRKFYAMVSDEGHRYLACVVKEAGDDPVALGLSTNIIPGGDYARTKIKDWSDKLGSVVGAFNSLGQQFTEDSSRPRVEFYRSQKDLILLLPVKVVSQ